MIADKKKQIPKESHPDSPSNRRDFLSWGLKSALGTGFFSFFASLRSLANPVGTIAFFKRRPVVATIAGTLWGAGPNSDGQLGTGNTTNTSSLAQVGSLSTWAQASASSTHAAAIKSDGTMWAWGLGTSGQIGNGAALSKSSPVQVGALTTWSTVCCAHSGGGHTLAVQSNGTLWGWGVGGSGQISTGGNRSSPTQIGTLTNWKYAGCGGYYSIGLKTDGTLWAWGSNSFGAHGISTGTANTSPIQIGTQTNWAKLAVGYEHVLAIKTDGTLWAWGNGTNGQLGSGAVVSKSSPIQIGSLTDWQEVTAGVYHSLALKTDGTLWGWGENYAGHAVGANTGGSVSSPMQVGNLTTWTAVSAGAQQTYALRSNGTLWSWGDGSSPAGGTALGNTSMIYSPRQVGSLTTWTKLGTGSRKFVIRSN